MITDNSKRTGTLVLDHTIQRIAEFASGLRYTDLPETVIHDCKRRIIDALGCGLAAYHAKPVAIARKIALRAQVRDGATVLGTTIRALPELSAFANGVAMRYLDGNDTYPGGGGHPSDTIAPVLTVADATGADSNTAITAIVLAYEIYHSIFDVTRVREKGWDHVLYTVIGSAVGAAKVMGLGRDQMAHAIALAITPNLALEVTRRGELSMWKGCAAGNAARNGVFAALLAAEGMTGPLCAVEGNHGLWDALGKFELGPFAGKSQPYRITQAHFKAFLSEYHSQAPISAALQLHGTIAFQDIKKVDVYTYDVARKQVGSEREKWHPKTRETADHSMPYIVAAVLVDGGFSDEIFNSERLSDLRIHELTEKVGIHEDPEFSRQFPGKTSCRIEITSKRGHREVAIVHYPLGHIENPMNDEQLNSKFRTLVSRTLRAEQADRLLNLLWQPDNVRPAEIFAAATVDDKKG